ncbi:hypothetical protein VTJ04DRAFT_79 [Mycothermus thermophilus]|uniref:uncharacterized protein n=1 Tax=Humicola insolens TaxID=85995 RepID=UPI00374491AE
MSTNLKSTPGREEYRTCAYHFLWNLQRHQRCIAKSQVVPCQNAAHMLKSQINSSPNARTSLPSIRLSPPGRDHAPYSSIPSQLPQNRIKG